MGLPGRAERPASRSLSRDRWRVVVFCSVLAVYLVVTLLIVVKSPLFTLDEHLANMHFRRHFPGLRPFIYYFVMLGQRGPATLLFLPYFLWAAWRRRSTTPIVTLVTALVLLNVSVGIVKYAVGRLGPRDHVADHRVSAHDVFAGGNIYPSGHVSNAVVLYGLIVIVAVNHRKLLAWIAAGLSLAIGLGTVFLDTHWFSDVLGGWLAGVLVLIALPWAMPVSQRWADALVARVRAWWRRRQARRRHSTDVPIGPPVSQRPPGNKHTAEPGRHTPVTPGAKLNP